MGPAPLPLDRPSKRPKTCLDGTLHRSSAGARVPSLYYVGRWPPFAMAEDAAGSAFHFAAAWGNLLDTLDVESGAPRPVEPGKMPLTMVAPET